MSSRNATAFPMRARLVGKEGGGGFGGCPSPLKFLFTEFVLKNDVEIRAQSTKSTYVVLYCRLGEISCLRAGALFPVPAPASSNCVLGVKISVTSLHDRTTQHNTLISKYSLSLAHSHSFTHTHTRILTLLR